MILAVHDCNPVQRPQSAAGRACTHMEPPRRSTDTDSTRRPAGPDTAYKSIVARRWDAQVAQDESSA
jgi:hypothetical protein